MASTNISTSETQTDATEQLQFQANQQGNQRVSRSIQDYSVQQSQDGSVWTRQPQDNNASDVATGGQRTVYGDTSPFAGMGRMNTQAETQGTSGRFDANKINDVENILTDSQRMLANLSSQNFLSGGEEEQLSTDVENLAQSSLNFASHFMQKLAEAWTDGESSSGGTSRGHQGFGGGCPHGAGGSDSGAGAGIGSANGTGGSDGAGSVTTGGIGGGDNTGSTTGGGTSGGDNTGSTTGGGTSSGDNTGSTTGGGTSGGDNTGSTAGSGTSGGDNTGSTTGGGTSGGDNTGSTTGGGTSGGDSTSSGAGSTTAGSGSASGDSGIVTDADVASMVQSDVNEPSTITAMPTSAASMDVGSSGTPALPADASSSLPTVTINGNSGLSALQGLDGGTLTQLSDGSYVFNGNDNQINPLALNGVTDLTVENCVWANTGSTAGVTISGACSSDNVINSSFYNVGEGVEVEQSNNIDPAGIAILNNYFDGINGPWPAASAVAFDGAGSSGIAAAQGLQNDVSHNTVMDASSNSALSGQDIMSFYNYQNGTPTVVTSNSINGSYEPADSSSHPPDTAINAEMSSNITVSNNFATDQSNAGLAVDGSTNVQEIGNLVTDSTVSYSQANEGGITAQATWSYNNSDQSPQVAVASADGGWPEVYEPDGPLVGNNNNWNLA